MSKLDPIFAAHDRSLAPGVPSPEAAVRDHVLYRSRERDVAERPRGFQGDAMEVALPGDFDQHLGPVDERPRKQNKDRLEMETAGRGR